jgi:hypothetical protein
VLSPNTPVFQPPSSPVSSINLLWCCDVTATRHSHPASVTSREHQIEASQCYSVAVSVWRSPTPPSPKANHSGG